LKERNESGVALGYDNPLERLLARWAYIYFIYVASIWWCFCVHLCTHLSSFLSKEEEEEEEESEMSWLSEQLPREHTFHFPKRHTYTYIYIIHINYIKTRSYTLYTIIAFSGVEIKICPKLNEECSSLTLIHFYTQSLPCSYPCST